MLDADLVSQIIKALGLPQPTVAFDGLWETWNRIDSYPRQAAPFINYERFHSIL